MKKLTVFLVLLLMVSFNAQSQKQYKTAKEAIAALYDFNESDGTLKVLKDGAEPEVVLTRHVVPNELPINVQNTLKWTCIYGVFRTFVHTNARSVTIVSQTQILKTKKITNKLTIKVSREKALECVKNLLGAKAFSELVKVTKFGDESSDKLKNAMYNDRKPGLDAVFAFLSK